MLHPYSNPFRTMPDLRITPRSRRAFVALSIGAASLLAACGDDTTSPGNDQEALFTVQVVNETFKVRVSNAAAVAAMRGRMQAGTEGVIIGQLASGNGGFNTGYGWHLDPVTVAVVDAAIEVCDGRPSDVQGDLPYWLNTVKSYCPWGAKVIAEQ